jgi:hypothetical protein
MEISSSHDVGEVLEIGLAVGDVGYGMLWIPSIVLLV